MEKIPFWGILTLIGAFCYDLGIGYLYTVANMTPYLIPYLNITKGQSVWFNSATLVAKAVTMPIGGFLHAKVGFRLPLYLGSVFSCGGLFLSRLTVNYGLGPFIVTYCLMFGIGMGLPYSVLFSVASSWFPEHRALIVGLIAAGFGLGALLFTPIQTALINPNNNPDFGQNRVENSFLIFGAIMLGLEAVGLIFCREYKPKLSLDTDESYIDEEVSRKSAKGEDGTIKRSESDESIGGHIEHPSAPIVRSYTVKEAFTCPDFYIIWTVFFLNTIPVTLISSTYKTFGKDFTSDDNYLSAIATTSSAFNCIGRIVWGLVCDKFSFKCPLSILLLIWAILFASFPFIGATEHFMVLYPIWVFSLYFILAGHFVLMPGATGRIFGPKYMSTIYGFVFSATLPSTLGLAIIVSLVGIDGKWDAVYLSCAGVCVIGSILASFLKDENGTCLNATSLCAKVCDPCRKELPDLEGDKMGDYEEEGDQP